MLVSGRPGRSKDLLQWAKQSPLEPGDSPHPAPPVPPRQPTEIVNLTPKVVPTVSIPAPTSEAPLGQPGDRDIRLPGHQFQRLAAQHSRHDRHLSLNGKALRAIPINARSGACASFGERSGAPSGLRPSSFVMANTPVEVQFTSAGCLNYPCRTSRAGRAALGQGEEPEASGV